MSISKKMKEWYTSIESLQFEGISEAVKEVLPVANPKYNQQVDSLLARLTHAYMKYSESKKDDRKTGLVVYELTCCLCDRFSESSNPPRLLSGIYHITRCLREIELFSESEKICNYVIPGKIFSPDVVEYEYFFKLSFAWRQSAEAIIKSLSSKFDSQTYNTLLEIVKFDFKLLKYSEKIDNYSKSLFARFQKYIDKITTYDKKWTENRIITFIKDIIEHLKMLQNNSTLKIDPLLIYEEIVDIMHSLSFRMINADRIKELYNFINKCANELEVFLVTDSQSQKCFQLHLDFYKTLLKPVSNFDKNMLEEISNYRRQFRSRLKSVGVSSTLTTNSSGINKLLTPLYNYWLECMQYCKIESINEIFFEIVKLVKQAASLLTTQSVKTCKCNLNTCKAKMNNFEQINMIQKCGTFVCMFDQKHLSKELLDFSRDFIAEIIVSIYHYKEANCGLYSSLWSTCGQVLYNLSLVTSLDFLDESAEMLSNLCSYIIQEDGIKSTNKFLRNSNPLSLALHKLSGVYFRAAKYREAMIVVAFNGLISYEDEEAKAFKMWANIKHKCNTEDIMKKSMIACLKADKAAIKELGVEIQLNNYDLIKLCAREIQGLQKAKVNLTPAIKASLKEMDSLQNNNMKFVEGVQYLGYHALYFRDDSGIIEYIKRAETYLSNFDQGSAYNSCLKANFEFLKFIERCNTTNKKIKQEIKNAKKIMQKGKNETMIHDETIETDEVVPVYRMINMKHDAEVTSQLGEVLLHWEKLFMKDPRAIINCWEPQIILNMIVIAGEIARLYLSQYCEKRAWVLAYKLASVLENRAVCLYVTARSISLRHINDSWIEKGYTYANSLKTSEDSEDKSAVGMFWISLSDFYFETGKKEEAVELLSSVKNLGTIGFASDVPVYLEFMDTVVRNYKLYSEDVSQEEYSEHIVHHIYSMISVNEINTGGKRVYYGINTLLDAVNHMSLIMNSFISFREISAHLTLRLELAQSLGATLRVAECLKSLCFIDLSRLKLDDCEVKLQGIEQILDVEGFGLTMKNKCPVSPRFRMNTVFTSHNMDVDDPLRDVIQNEASPILRKKIFVPPEFMLHDNCKCYRCLNIPYQYLVFSSTHIRAQVYALKDHSSVALQHFQGAFDVRSKLLEKENSKMIKKNNNSTKYYPWQKYYTMVDFVLFLLDFSKFIMNYRTPREREAMEIVIEAVKICEKYNLETHPVYFAAKELFFRYRFQKLNLDFSAFTVPDIDDIDISNLVSEEVPHKEYDKVKSCFTPSHSGDLPIKVLHRKKTPPLLPLTKVEMCYSDSEDEESKSTRKPKKKPPRKRLVILEGESSKDEAAFKPVSKSSSRVKSVSSKKSVDSKTTKVPLIVVDETEELGEALKEMSLQPYSCQFINSCGNLLSKVRNLKVEHLQNSPKFEFSEEELNILNLVMDVKEFQEIKELLEKITVNLTKADNTNNAKSTRISRSRKALSFKSEDLKEESIQDFEKTIKKVIDTLTNVISSSKISSGEAKSLTKSKRSTSPKDKLNSRILNISRSSSPDLFPSDDEVCIQKHSDSRVQKSKDKLSQDSVESCSQGARVTRSRSLKISSDSDSVELNPKTSSKIPRKKS